MNLDDAQKQKVAVWIGDGLTLSQIQSRLASELGITMTYMEVRFLMDDLKLKPKDKPPAVNMTGTAQPGSPGAPAPGVSGGAKGPGPAQAIQAETTTKEAGTGRGVTVSVDQVTRPGALVSGRVTFSDAMAADWYLDQMGRLGLAPMQQGYRPSQQDLQTFQLELQNELQRLGL